MAELTIKLTEKMVLDRQHCNEDSDCSKCSCCMANDECLFNFIEEHNAGKWSILACDLYMCSKCYAKFTHKFNYCPNCGAEMRGSEE